MATKIPAARTRLFWNVFVCKDCSSKMRADARKIAEQKVRCRKCKGKHFRPISKK